MSGAASVILSRLQTLLGGIYDLGVDYDVYDFLVTDRGSLPPEVRHRRCEEDLIIAEPACAPQSAGEAERPAMQVSLYLDPALIDRLARADPLERLHGGNVADCWAALEGVSHFLCVAWHAEHDRPVSLLELEIQAEVDKYVISCLLLQRQSPRRFPAELRRLLFDRARIDPDLADGREALYRRASRYAEKFCRELERDLRSERIDAGQEVLARLRRFYRLPGTRKLAHIDSTGTC